MTKPNCDQAGPNLTEPFIETGEYQFEGRADCGCLLENEGNAGARMILCPMHKAAPQLLALLTELLDCCELNLDDDMGPDTLELIDRVTGVVNQLKGK